MVVLASESGIFFVLFQALPTTFFYEFDLDFWQQCVYLENAALVDLEWPFLN